MLNVVVTGACILLEETELDRHQTIFVSLCIPHGSMGRYTLSDRERFAQTYQCRPSCSRTMHAAVRITFSMMEQFILGRASMCANAADNQVVVDMS
jgi:hypothetical protein